MTRKTDGCAKPAAGPIRSAAAETAAEAAPEQGGTTVTARVGSTAPDFEATAYVSGAFENIKLSDHKGKWVVLCFYPGDFTFV